jgi:hypothetical protein
VSARIAKSWELSAAKNGVIAGLANTDPPAASELIEFFDQRLPG